MKAPARPRPEWATPRLSFYWDRKVGDLVADPMERINAERSLVPGARERHRLYSLLLMALIFDNHNGNKRGRRGRYFDRADQVEHRVGDGDDFYAGGDYIGHNIAAIAVDGEGLLIDFEFNQNEIARSSVEHAESRLVRRVFALTNIWDRWDTGLPPGPRQMGDYNTVLSKVSVYTSLESCSQCAGIMALGKVKEVVYLQRDPQFDAIGNTLYNLSHDGSQVVGPLPSPLPISADWFDLPYFAELNDEFQRFSKRIGPDSPFFQNPARKDDRVSITSFLCTDTARGIFERAARQLDELSAEDLVDCRYRPPFDPDRDPEPLTNAKVLEHVREFRAYARSNGFRSTPHGFF